MFRRTASALIALALVLAGAAPAAASTATDEMIRCAALGDKRPGTAADAAMGDRLLDRFRAGGLETSAETFHMPVWKAERTRLAIVGGPPLAAETFAYSGSGRVRAQVVDVGAAQPSDFQGKDVRGKIVLVENSGTYHRTVQVEQVMSRGGAAMIYVSASPRNLVQTGAVRWGQRPPATIPALTIGADTGAALRARMEAGPVTLDLDAAGERVDAVTRNIVGIRRGTTYPDRYIVVAGHYDSWYAGANDNCSAVGTLLSVVEANRDVAPAYTMVYIGWGAEEQGLVGSYTWLHRHQDLVPKVVMNVNLEETATATFSNGEPTSLPSPTLLFGSTSPAMVALASATSAANGVVPAAVIPTAAYRASSGGIIATDIEGFYAQGVQGVSTASSSPFYHTTEDTEDKINLADLDRATSFIEDFTRVAQTVPPDGFALREVPTVTVTAPARAAAGAAVPVDVRVTGVDGRPLAGERVLVLADQRDNWAVAESYADDLGGGRYRWTLPAGASDADLTRLRATVSTTAYLASGFATIDQRQGGLLGGSSTAACRSRRTITMHVARRSGARRVTRLRVRTSTGRFRVTKSRRRYTIRLDLRGAAAGPVRVRLTARTARRGTVRQTRTFRTCARRR